MISVTNSTTAQACPLGADPITKEGGDPMPRTMPGFREETAYDPILHSKITAPAVPAWVVPRARLASRIAQGTLTSVTGPPGAGKTVVAASWADGYDCGPVAWVRLDEFDNRAEVFWSYVLAALRRAGVAVSHAAAVLPC